MEAARVEKLLGAGGVSASKVEELARKLSVLQSILRPEGEGDGAGEGEGDGEGVAAA
jgi:hypothetical protein